MFRLKLDPITVDLNLNVTVTGPAGADDRLDQIMLIVNDIRTRLGLVQAQEAQDMADINTSISNLTQDVQNQSTVVDGVETLVSGIATVLADLRAQVGDNAAAVAAIDAADASIRANANRLAVAVAAGTAAASETPAGGGGSVDPVTGGTTAGGTVDTGGTVDQGGTGGVTAPTDVPVDSTDLGSEPGAGGAPGSSRTSRQGGRG